MIEECTGRKKSGRSREREREREDHLRWRMARGRVGRVGDNCLNKSCQGRLVHPIHGIHVLGEQQKQTNRRFFSHVTNKTMGETKLKYLKHCNDWKRVTERQHSQRYHSWYIRQHVQIGCSTYNATIVNFMRKNCELYCRTSLQEFSCITDLHSTQQSFLLQRFGPKTFLLVCQNCTFQRRSSNWSPKTFFGKYNCSTNRSCEKVPQYNVP